MTKQQKIEWLNSFVHAAMTEFFWIMNIKY